MVDIRIIFAFFGVLIIIILAIITILMAKKIDKNRKLLLGEPIKLKRDNTQKFIDKTKTEQILEFFEEDEK